MLVLLAGVILLARSAAGSVSYSAELAHANGLRAGDKVRVAGLDVGTVDSISARGTTVHVDFSLDRDARLTRETATSVKLARSEEHTSELQSQMRISSATFC